MNGKEVCGVPYTYLQQLMRRWRALADLLSPKSTEAPSSQVPILQANKHLGRAKFVCLDVPSQRFVHKVAADVVGKGVRFLPRKDDMFSRPTMVVSASTPQVFPVRSLSSLL